MSITRIFYLSLCDSAKIVVRAKKWRKCLSQFIANKYQTMIIAQLVAFRKTMRARHFQAHRDIFERMESSFN